MNKNNYGTTILVIFIVIIVIVINTFSASLLPVKMCIEQVMFNPVRSLKWLAYFYD